MKIAIDAHAIGTEAGGNETYFRQLLHGLAEDKTANDYTVFCTNSSAQDCVCGDPRFHFVPVPRSAPVRLCFSLPSLLARIKPDVFHCQYVKPLFASQRTVVTIHDITFEAFPQYFPRLQMLRMKTLIKRTARQADHILTVSNYSAAELEKRYNIPRSRITVTYLAAADRFQPRDQKVSREQLARQYGIHDPFILYVGRIQARKNLPRLVEAYARLRRQEAKIKLVIVGNRDWQAERLLSLIRDLRLESSIVFPGYVRPEDLPMFYNAAEVFVFPSIFEGFGLPVLESMASGVPTITSYGTSLEEVAADGALLVDPLDVTSIANALENVLTDSELRNRLIACGLRRAAQFPAQNLTRKTLDVYHMLGG